MTAPAARPLRILTVCSHNRTRSVMMAAMLQAKLIERLGDGSVVPLLAGAGVVVLTVLLLFCHSICIAVEAPLRLSSAPGRQVLAEVNTTTGDGLTVMVKPTVGPVQTAGAL